MLKIIVTKAIAAILCIPKLKIKFAKILAPACDTAEGKDRGREFVDQKCLKMSVRPFGWREDKTFATGLIFHFETSCLEGWARALFS